MHNYMTSLDAAELWRQNEIRVSSLDRQQDTNSIVTISTDTEFAMALSQQLLDTHKKKKKGGGWLGVGT